MGIIVDNTESHDGQPALEQKTVRSISEGNEVISRWKEENSQFSVDVPPDMSPQTAKTLKQNFKKEGASHLIQGTTINSILEKALVSAKSEFDIVVKEVEDLQHFYILHPHQMATRISRSPLGLFQCTDHTEMVKTNDEILGRRRRLVQKEEVEL
ncbi:uncharacterized protein LOC133906922 isoform X2 [Phragmites australis]|uniref:uncharacterized protein LOC133906922 isoform X2 n=1 Tax=Phragmites australis TaxID=29695 RepID=UPI002D78B0C7|nr:uncharacterized protein LOC133906922 isoform X2 [Phragmites australis]